MAKLSEINRKLKIMHFLILCFDSSALKYAKNIRESKFNNVPNDETPVWSLVYT